MAEDAPRVTPEEFERLKEKWKQPRKSYAEMTDEEVEERYRELGLPPPMRAARGAVVEAPLREGGR